MSLDNISQKNTNHLEQIPNLVYTNAYLYVMIVRFGFLWDVSGRFSHKCVQGDFLSSSKTVDGAKIGDSFIQSTAVENDRWTGVFLSYFIHNQLFWGFLLQNFITYLDRKMHFST